VQRNERNRPVVLLRSGWQTENIGDIAHTPGMLRLLNIHLPDAETILWSNALDRGVREMLAAHFPNLRFVSGEPESPEVAAAFKQAGLMLHGSGPSVVAWRHLEAWRKHTGRPYGVFGVTITPPVDNALKEVLDSAMFVFTREMRSLENVNAAGINKPTLGFAPDATFAIKIADDASAKSFLAQNGLEVRKFIAVVPRLRYTPYHKMRPVNWSEDEIARRTAVNNAHAESDHAKLRVVIVNWVRATGFRALLCPEMTYQVDIIDPLLYDPLPDAIKKSIVRRKTYWLPSEAASVYRRAAAVISFECHSPIIAAANDTPCIYVHQPEDGIKGQMWHDVGLAESYFEVEQTTGAQLADRVMAIHRDFDSAQVRVHERVIYARQVQARAMEFVRKAVLGRPGIHV
jgi:polysaccharide pyruvyl transferase WcaK-like protein